MRLAIGAPAGCPRSCTATQRAARTAARCAASAFSAALTASERSCAAVRGAAALGDPRSAAWAATAASTASAAAAAAAASAAAASRRRRPLPLEITAEHAAAACSNCTNAFSWLFITAQPGVLLGLGARP